MRSFLKKYKLPINVLLILVLALGSVSYFMEYDEAENKKLKLVSAITIGMLAIIKTVDIIGYYRNRKKAQ